MKIKGREVHEGDIIAHRGTGEAYVVVLVHEDRAAAIRSVTVTDDAEWEIAGCLAPLDGLGKRRT